MSTNVQYASVTAPGLNTIYIYIYVLHACMHAHISINPHTHTYTYRNRQIYRDEHRRGRGGGSLLIGYSQSCWHSSPGSISLYWYRSLSTAPVCVRVCVCWYTHTHTHELYWYWSLSTAPMCVCVYTYTHTHAWIVLIPVPTHKHTHTHVINMAWRHDAALVANEASEHTCLSLPHMSTFFFFYLSASCISV